MSEENRSQINARQVMHLLLDERREGMPEVSQQVLTDELIDKILTVGYSTQFDQERNDVQKLIRELVLSSIRAGMVRS